MQSGGSHKSRNYKQYVIRILFESIRIDERADIIKEIIKKL